MRSVVEFCLVTRCRWRYSKRLIYGSLVCLSSDDFASIRIATVAHRDPEHLQDGELIIQFETDMEQIRLLPPTERFLMVETSAYFEAYRHVLLALQVRLELLPTFNNLLYPPNERSETDGYTVLLAFSSRLSGRLCRRLPSVRTHI